MLEINGSYMEGGGSIVRLAVALSCITQKPIKITNIRSGRDEPGLKTQHLRAIESVSKLCKGSLKGAYLNSRTIEFIPNKIERHSLTVNIETAGSVSLLLQCLMLPCFYAKHNVEVRIVGGATVGRNAPNLLYISNVLLPTIKKMGFNCSIEIGRHGFYPKGAAYVTFNSKPLKETSALNLDSRGKLEEIEGICLASEDLEKRKVCERMSKMEKKILTDKFDCPVKIRNSYERTICPGVGTLLWANFENCILGFDIPGERWKPAEAVAREACNRLIEQINSKATVDEFLTDQILIYMALTNKPCSIVIPRLTDHAKTNMWLIEQFLPVKFNVNDNLLTCGPVV